MTQSNHWGDASPEAMRAAGATFMAELKRRQQERESNPVSAAIDQLRESLSAEPRSENAFDRALSHLNHLQELGEIDPPVYRPGWKPSDAISGVAVGDDFDLPG